MQMHEKQASHTFLAQFRPRLTPTPSQIYVQAWQAHHTTPDTCIHKHHTYHPITYYTNRNPACLALLLVADRVRNLLPPKRAAFAKTEPIPDNGQSGSWKTHETGPIACCCMEICHFPFNDPTAEKKKTSPNTQGSIMIIIIVEAGRHDWPRQGSWPQQGVASKHRQWENTKKGREMEACCQAN